LGLRFKPSEWKGKKCKYLGLTRGRVDNSKAVHRAYAKRALMKIPSLEDYEQRAAVKVAPAA